MPSRWFRGAATLCLVWLASTASSARLPDEGLPRVKAMQQRILLEEPAEKLERLERFEKWHRNRKAHAPRRNHSGMRLRGEKRADLVRARQLDLFARARPRALSALTAPTNVLMNDTLGEPDGSCQSEVSIAAFGDNLVAAWNDGIGVYDSPPTDTQGFAYSTDGGVTWVDGGVPPTANIGRWSSDPVVVVNEKTGAFYYCGLTDQTGTNGIGMVKGTFSGSSFSWGTPVSVAEFDNFAALLDKQWMAVDSISGNLYITYSHFVASGGQLVSDEIRFTRSTNDGQNWTTPVRVSRVSDDGYVQGSRVAVGPAGELHLVWHAIGKADNSPYGRDFLRVRRSNDQGSNFSPEVTADSLFSNFPSGAPGFNRPIGITFPAIAVDRSTGPYRGRVYLAWNEALNFYADVASLPDPRPPFNSAGLVETENNNGPNVADQFTPGVILRGVISVPGNPGDFDYWKWNATQGTTYFFWLDSMGVNLDASFRIFCTDGNANLAFNQNGTGDGNGGELLVFTAPTSGQYYLRVASYSGDFTGAYRVLTTVHTPRGDDRARDHRDLFVKSSPDGFTWGPTTRVNDSPTGFDDFLPEVAVDGYGRVFVAAYDWRDAPNCGGGSNVYLYRSDNGGANWVGGTRVSDFTTDWNATYSTLIPNQGDYIGMFAKDSTVFVAWSDGRNLVPAFSDPDVYVAATQLNCTAAPVAADGIVVSATRDTATVTWAAPDGTPATLFRRVGSGAFVNLGPVVANVLGQIVYVDTQVAPGNTYTYRLGVTGFCETVVGEQGVTIPGPTGPLLGIIDLRPNPSPGDIRVTFTLASSEKATLALYDIGGRLIRSLDVTDRGPGGPHSVLLYTGSRLRSGIYFIQLSQGGDTKERRVSVFP